jgi:hypothetical protein
MKYAIVALILAFSATDASAIVCAAGAYHAGCVRRAPVAGAAVVAPARGCRWVVVNGVRVRRCY